MFLGIKKLIKELEKTKFEPKLSLVYQKIITSYKNNLHTGLYKAPSITKTIITCKPTNCYSNGNEQSKSVTR